MSFGVTGYHTGNGTSSLGSVSQTITPTVGGETILVFGGSRNAAWASSPVSDNLSSTYTQAWSIASTTTTIIRSVCYVLNNAPAGINSISLARVSAATTGFELLIAVITGSNGGNPDVVVSAAASASGAALASGTSSASIAKAGELSFGFGVNGSASSSFTTQAFGGTAATYGAWNSLGVENDGASGQACSANFGYATLSGGTLGTIAFSETATVGGSGWCCGCLTIKPLETVSATATVTPAPTVLAATGIRTVIGVATVTAAPLVVVATSVDAVTGIATVTAAGVTVSATGTTPSQTTGFIGGSASIPVYVVVPSLGVPVPAGMVLGKSVIQVGMLSIIAGGYRQTFGRSGLNSGRILVESRGGKIGRGRAERNRLAVLYSIDPILSTIIANNENEL